ncbi:unnamed protein product [Sphagnum balticum]
MGVIGGGEDAGSVLKVISLIATEIGGVGIVGSREGTSSILEVVPFVASETVTIRIKGGALVRNGDASFLGIEDPIFGASETDLIVPIPGSTAEIGGVGIIRGREDTRSAVKIVSLIAS